MYYPTNLEKLALGGFMATIIRKIKKGNPYYYAVESKRVDGKPRIVWQKYLGTLDDIVKSRSESSEVDIKEVDVFEAGGVAAMVRVAQKLHIAEIIDEIIPKRKQGATVSQYLLLAAINRVCSPCSKLQISDWYQKSVLYRLWKLPPETFTSQMFWNHMDLIPEDSIDLIQEKIVLCLKKKFKIDPSTLLYDTTNFFTYVATGNTRNTIAQRGRNKVKRDDLRQVGLALLVSKDFQIPLFHKTYRGNQSDRGLFPEMSKEIVEWQQSILKTTQQTTLVFDKGNISEDAMERLMVAGQPFVCAVPKNTDTELFTIDIENFSDISELPGTKAHSVLVEIWSKKLKAVLAYSESFFMSELAELTATLRKCEQQLHELEKWLEKGPSRPHDVRYYSLTHTKNKINNIISKPYAKEIIKVKIESIGKTSHIQYSIDQKKLDLIMKTCLGRTLIFSSRLEWDEKEIISAYRSQNNIEEVFKLMKNRDYLHWQPSFHWTDQKIKIHSLYCVLALLMATIAHKTAVENGIDITLLQMLDELQEIREVALIPAGKDSSKVKSKIVLSRMSPRQKRLSEALEIHTALKG